MISSENEFWSFFDSTAAPRLAQREETFRKIFQYLDRFPTPVTIVETGCIRTRDNWAGDGQSTILFDKYVSSRANGSGVFSVDKDPASVEMCRTLVSSNVNIMAAESVVFLNVLTKQFVEQGVKVHLFYFDSFDLDTKYWFPSASHHLKELVSAWRSIDKDTLVVVDDCPLDAQLVRGRTGFDVLGQPSVGGKGRLVAEFAQQIGVEPLFSSYQAGWVGF
jgi:hypothetical protein